MLLVRLPTSDALRSVVYDALGRKVAETQLGRLPTGQRIIRWDAKGMHGMPLASGVYCTIVSGKAHSGLLRLLHLK
jgi:hypothetical protein